MPKRKNNEPLTFGLLLCWRTEEQSAFEKLSANTNIQRTEFISAFVVNFIISFLIGFSFG